MSIDQPSQELFQPRWITTKGGKHRQLWIPTEETLPYHQDLLQRLYALEIDMPFAKGSVPGTRLIDNALAHKDNNYVYMTDLKNAFPSVQPVELLDILAELVPVDELRDIFDLVHTYALSPDGKGLPLGAPCSPYLFNIYCSKMDKALGEYCEEESIVYTRYLDDLTFSSESPIGDKRRKWLRELIEYTSDLKINHARGKSRYHNLGNGPVTITGVSIYPDGHLQPAPHLIDMARIVFRNFAKSKVDTTDPYEIGLLFGWHGVISDLRDHEAIVPPRLIELDATYRRALGLLAADTALTSSVPYPLVR